MAQTTQQLLDKLIEDISSDQGIELGLKEQLTELINAVSIDPTAGNLEALAIVMDKLADVNQYREAMISLQNLRLNSEVLKPET